jgi:hypothetical protein
MAAFNHRLKDICMRAEIANLSSEIEQGLALLRRHL